MRQKFCLWAGIAALAASPASLHAQTAIPAAPAQTPLVAGKRALAAKEFAHAKIIFRDYLRAHPDDVQGQLGLGDAELGLHEYEAAEANYRRVIRAEPLLWAAHKNLVIVEAALGRWEDFDGERTVLRAARQRGAAGIDRRDNDVIDVINVKGQRWIVRDYFQPLGRSRSRYNFERFSPQGRVLAYVSLESADAFREQKYGADVVIGGPDQGSDPNGLALDWYNGRAHGTIAKYATEPKYERLRAEFLSRARSR